MRNNRPVVKHVIVVSQLEARKLGGTNSTAGGSTKAWWKRRSTECGVRSTEYGVRSTEYGVCLS